MNFAGVFDYFQHAEVFLLARDGVQYPRIFPIHSRINSRNFTDITQAIMNTLLKKFECPYSQGNAKKLYLAYVKKIPMKCSSSKELFRVCM